MDYLKAEQIGTTKWRVLAIPFGGPLAGGRDLDGEYFSPRTDVKASWFKERPVLWHHAQDETVGDEALGVQDELKQEADGWWAEMWLNRSSRYWAQVDSLLRAGKVYGSSGALGHLVRKAADGEILVWPHIEQTLTPTPANPFARVVPAKALAAFTSAGIAPESMKGLLADLSRLADLADDLRTDLPSGGDAVAAPAATRRLDALRELRDALRP